MLGSRGRLVTLIVCALGLGATLPVTAASAKTKKCVTKSGKRAKCPKPKPKPKHKKVRLGVPVAITVLGGSHATVDLGSGNVRQVPLGGFVFGYSPQEKIDITKDIPVVLVAGNVSPHATDLVSDTTCGASSVAVRLGALSDDAVTGGTGLVKVSDGSVTSTAGVKLNLQFDVRPSCGAALVPAQPSTPASVSFALSGKISPATGLTRLELTAPPTPVTVKACLTPGGSGGVCAGPAQDLTGTIALDLFLRVDLNAGAGFAY
jgi:hypothetical protein